MNLLTIFDSLYQSKLFTTGLPIAIILLLFLFLFLFFLGIRDRKEKKNERLAENNENKKNSRIFKKKEEKKEVTFEESSLTQNLQNFKKAIEEEIKKEDNGLELKPDGKEFVEILDEKKVPVLDKEKIEDTVMTPFLFDEGKDLEIPKSKKNA